MPTRLYEKLDNRDSMHISPSDGNHAALSLMISDVVRWTCMASTIRAEVNRIVQTLCFDGIYPSQQALGETPVVTSATDLEADAKLADETAKLEQRDASPDYESDDELRQGSRIKFVSGQRLRLRYV